jgi:hypothetical protein
MAQEIIGKPTSGTQTNDNNKAVPKPSAADSDKNQALPKTDMQNAFPKGPFGINRPDKSGIGRSIFDKES